MVQNKGSRLQLRVLACARQHSTVSDRVSHQLCFAIDTILLFHPPSPYHCLVFYAIGMQIGNSGVVAECEAPCEGSMSVCCPFKLIVAMMDAFAPLMRASRAQVC